MNELTGWLLDVYTHPKAAGLIVWLLGDGGVRHRLYQLFPVTFYAAGEPARLRALWRYLQSQPVKVSLARARRRDLFASDLLTVLEIRVACAAEQPPLFRGLKRRFPDLEFYDADLPLLARYAALYDVFPLTRCKVAVDSQGWVQAVVSLESRWEPDPALPPLRILQLEPDVDPFHAQPTGLIVQSGRYGGRMSLEPERPLLASLAGILKRYDPDLILTTYGDAWLLPRLLDLSRRWDFPLPLNRDPDCPVTLKAERTYHTYGTVIHQAEQVHLHGRWHIDRRNAMMFGDYGMDGVFELARVSGLPVQVAAHNSPGSGITAMQMITALRQGILVPHRKQQAENFKSAADLIAVDRGGLVYQPLVGLHRDVAEIDFISMYPSIMRRFNISPETVGDRHLDREHVRALRVVAPRDRPGLYPATLAPLLDKRSALKARLSGLHPRDCRYRSYKARASALKWLLVVCFGYTGYKNARFGKIEAHEAITAYSREALLRAKEAAEELGFTVLHMYVDGLWIQKTGAARVADFQPVLEAIAQCTGLDISLDGIYKWVAFLSSKVDDRVPVANRYFGVFQSGEIKVRGIEARRSDTPAFIARLQMDVLALLARAPTAAGLPALLPEVVALLRRRLNDLLAGRWEIEQLLVRQKLSRRLEDYRVPSPAARAARQLAEAGKPLGAGDYVRFIYARGQDGVLAWDLPSPPGPAHVDRARYRELLLRAAGTLLQPLGVDAHRLRGWLLANAAYGAPPGELPENLPLVSQLGCLAAASLCHSQR